MRTQIELILEVFKIFLSKAAIKALHNISYTWSSITVIDYWIYEDETLTRRYLELEFI